jgi:SAM-dependent methyltransferase
MSRQPPRFEFGKNWRGFIERSFSEERVDISRKQMLAFLGLESLEGKYFLDIGCGSGLHSLAALRAGASRVVSFDIDPQAVLTTRKLKEYAGDPSNWDVMEGSALDPDFLNRIEPADVVYSWGVLHHTGEMWKAIRYSAALMKSDGVMFLALYQDVPHMGRPMAYWVEIKRRYNEGDWVSKKRLEWWYVWEFKIGRNLRMLPSLIKRARDYKQNRGMDLFTDIVDWLGGWPFEYAPAWQVREFVEKELSLQVAKSTVHEANAEYLLVRSK